MNPYQWSVRLFNAFDIEVRMHYAFLIFAGIALFQAAPGGAAAMTNAGLFYAMLFGIVLVHEFGHCFGARSVNGDARVILMWPLGGLAYAHAPMRPWPQFVTVAAGPLVNVIFCILSGFLIFLALGVFKLSWLNPLDGVPWYIDAPFWVNLVGTFYSVNLFLLAFNLLPIYPLDGGQLFHSIIWPHVGLRRATEIACYVGLIGAVLMGIYGVFSMRAGTGFGHSMLIVIALFGGLTCWQRLQMAQQGMLVEDDQFSYSAMNVGRRESWWSRFKKKFSRPKRSRPDVQNPNPGGWERKQTEQSSTEVEIDRILKKVSEHGVNSLTYGERKALERASRERQKQDREFDRRRSL